MSHIGAVEGSLGLGEVAALVRRDERTVRRWIASGRLQAYRLGDRELRVPRSEVERLLASFLTPQTTEGESQAVA